MIRRYFVASAHARILHIGPVRPSALDRTACGHIIDRAAGWQDVGPESRRERNAAGSRRVPRVRPDEGSGRKAGAVMAAKKGKKAKNPKRRPRVRILMRRRFLDLPPEHRRFRLWCHDLDTILHEYLKNPAIIGTAPEEIVKIAARFADAYRAEQEARKPEGMRFEDTL